MRLTTEERLAATRGAIVRWERRLRRAGNALQKYRQAEARLVRRLNSETAKQAAPVPAKARRPGRKITLD